jgi:hypothetical protein
MNGKHKASAVLLLCLALSAFRASADGAATFGSNAGFDDISGLDPIASVQVFIPSGTDATGTSWNCAVTCSAEVSPTSPGGTATLSILDQGVVVTGSGRTSEMGVLLPMAISTTARTTLSTATNFETLACAMQAFNGAVIAVIDSSITAVCTDFP